MEDYSGFPGDDHFADDQSVGSVGSLAHLDDDSVHGDEENQNTPEALVNKRSKAIRRTKYLLLMALITAGICLAAAAAILFAEDEENDEDSNDTSGTKAAGIVGAVFALLIIIFLRYDFLVSRRNSIVLDMANKSKNIVDQLFPEGVRDRLMLEQEASRRSSINGTSNNEDDPQKLQEVDFKKLTEMNTRKNSTLSPAKQSKDVVSAVAPISPLKRISSIGDEVVNSNRPIADLYPNCTVLFADLAGFTGWASERDPAQVFTLLETVYAAFDELGKKLKVFKVETIGDCYLAVTGLPEPDDNHAINMARFAFQCLQKMGAVTSELESRLGPGTDLLTVRIGLHSGSVTAGVLRGQKSRFQLFGDTVNTASRIESTGQKGRIQVSEETADLLRAAGKSHWLKERPDRVAAKGKGTLRTFWLEPGRRGDNEGSPRSRKKKTVVAALPTMALAPDSPKQQKSVAAATVTTEMKEQYDKLIDWNTDVILKYLANVASSSSAKIKKTKSVQKIDHIDEVADMPPPLSLVSDCITFPPFEAFRGEKSTESIDVSSLRNNVREFVTEIAQNYTQVPFHNFEHASHVAMAADKLLQRMTSSTRLSPQKLHSRSLGISSDPVTQIAILLAALIHDVGHPGVPNAQLVKEEHPFAAKFKNQSVAEQHSVTLGWEILMKKRYTTLRKAIYSTNVERKRFRQVLVNAVMATDIADRSFNQERARKWERAFMDDPETDSSGSLSQLTMNRRATVVIEHLMQVADVSHTMQDWTIYRRWNTRLYEEMNQAYRADRAAFDPSETWFKGEIGFFDFYIIPLASKMRDSGVFGASGAQYLKGAQSNRAEWESQGEKEVKEMVEQFGSPEESDDEDDESEDDSIMEGYDETSVVEIMSIDERTFL